MKLSRDTARIERFGPNLVSCLLNLVIELADHCLEREYDISGVSAFDPENDEWPNALLSIYEAIYLADCQKLIKIMTAKGMTPMGLKIPEGVVCYSSSIRPFLTYLNDWRSREGGRKANKLAKRMD